jgi:serine protease
MKKWLVLLVFFVLGLGFALSNFQGLAAQGTYQAIVLDFREDIGAAQIEMQIEALAEKYKVAPRYNSEFSFDDHVFIMPGNASTLKELQHSEFAKYTEFIEPDYIYRAYAAPNDPDYAKQWNLRNIQIEPAWDRTKGKGVKVAVIDTGISRVPDLKETDFVSGYDFVSDRTEARDDNGHGTHVAGTIAQSTNNSFGVAGIAYEASLMPLKVLGTDGGGTVADIAEAIRFAADQGADVINLSLGGGGESKLLKEAVDYAHSKNLVIVAAAGNSNRNAADYPARYPHVIAVGALDATGSKTPYSNFGAGIDITAPGGMLGATDKAGGILQNTFNPQTGESVFEAFQGTSMAAPHVAGVAALIKAVGVKNPDEVEEVLKQSAVVISDDPSNHYGAGRLDAAAAVNLAAQGKISFQDFFRWLRDSGYLNPRFWIDGGVIALWPKVIMVLGSYALAWLLKIYLPMWGMGFSAGVVLGSVGLFPLRGMYLFDAPQWPFRLMGSSIPELGSAVQGTGELSPITASVLIPLVLVLLFLGHAQWKWVAVGTTLGFASCLLVSAVIDPALLWIGDGAIAQFFLVSNALLCLGLAYLAVKPTPGAPPHEQRPA